MTVRVRVTKSAIALSALLWMGEARAAGPRCGDAIASAGATADSVRKTCGEPDKVDTVRLASGTYERWTYDFGSNHFVGIGLFLNGRLAYCLSGGRGHKPPR